MIPLTRVSPGRLKFIEKAGERIIIATFCGRNRPAEFADYQEKVFTHFGIPLNQVLADFSRLEHGSVIDEFILRLDGAWDYLILFDTDAVPLKADFIERAYEKIRDKTTLFGIAQQSNHILVNNCKNHLYVGPAALAVSKEMLVRLDRPSFLRNARSDTAEELTWRAEERGYTLAFIFPSHVRRRRWDLGNGHSFGVGTTYGDAVFHAFVPTDEESKKFFVRKCKEVLRIKGG